MLSLPNSMGRFGICWVRKVRDCLSHGLRLPECLDWHHVTARGRQKPANARLAACASTLHSPLHSPQIIALTHFWTAAIWPRITSSPTNSQTGA
jgi:hypothetical protein